MVALKAFLFLILNLGMGYILVLTLRFVLFRPKTKKYLGRVHIPLTPGLFYRIKEMLFKKIYDFLHSFLHDCQNTELDNKIKEIENDIYNHILERTELFCNCRFLPDSVKKGMQRFAAQLVFELTRYFVRTFVPFLIEKYEVESYMDMLRDKADISILEEYYTRYIHRFLLYFMLFFFFFAGFFNMIIYLIIR